MPRTKALRNNKNKIDKKKVEKLSKIEDLSSLPGSNCTSQEEVYLQFDKYEAEKLPRALSSLNDISNTTQKAPNSPDLHVKTLERVRKLLTSPAETEGEKLRLITNEIYKVAHSIADAAHSPNKRSDKSIDTLMLEYEEKELYNKLQQIPESFITESDNILDDGNTQNSRKDELASVVIRNNVKDRLNYK